jgi:hypothetical protein
VCGVNDVVGAGHRTPAANEKLLGGKYRSVVRFVPVNWDAMHALFRAFDSDNDGSLDKQEVRAVVRVVSCRACRAAND